MENVLYRIRNGKIVDPNIPTDGLVCCLDTRGKYNTDIYRNTLLDLSGNGNDGTLQNFSFTEGSGYVEGLSVCGLKFDGVDDRLTLQKDVYLSNINSTIYMSCKMHNILDEDSYRSLFSLGTFSAENPAGSFYWIYTSPYYGGNVNLQFRPEDNRNTTNGLMTNLGPETELKVVLRLTDNEIYVNVNGLIKTIPQNPFKQELKLRIGAYTDSAMPVTYIPNLNLGNLKEWNRALTDEEITKLMEV